MADELSFAPVYDARADVERNAGGELLSLTIVCVAEAEVIPAGSTQTRKDPS